MLIATEEEMTALGGRVAPILRRGDCLLLRGDLGVGKSTFARGLIRARAGAPIDVPSPSFSLVEVYQMDIPLHHVDLYRLERFEQALELGLEDLTDSGITLVEWPDRAEDLFPDEALNIQISEAEGERDMAFNWKRGDWQTRLSPVLGQSSGG
jgi:tRNA threonylcarbamoyl adenosine modification protein YjeE